MTEKKKMKYNVVILKRGSIAPYEETLIEKAETILENLLEDMPKGLDIDLFVFQKILSQRKGAA